jgi:hypothetical protein
MGFYNMVLGDGSEGKRGDVLLAILETANVGRFRDAWVEKAEDGEPVIAIYTRNGGGNREDYEEVISAMQRHPCYIRDADDDFDCTYATFYFKVPEQFRDALREYAQDPVNMSDVWLKVIENLKAPA